MRGSNRIAAAATVVVAFLMLLVGLPALAQVAPPACPLSEGIVLNAQGETWGLNFIRSDRGEAQAFLGPGAAAIPAGRYNVVLASWDTHGGDHVQLNEQWQLVGAAGGEVVFASGATPDLPETETLLVATVNVGVDVPEITEVVAAHAAYPNRESPNSIWPLCASFIPVPPAADLGVTLTDSADPVLVGDSFDYELSITNAGPDPATGVVASLVLPEEVAFGSAPAGCVHSGEVSDGTVTCDVGDLPVEGSASFTVTVTALAASETPVVATGSVSGNEVDPDPSNNTASQETTIEMPAVPQADLAVVKTVADASIELDDGPAVFEIVVTNNGPDSGVGVVAVDTLPAGFTFVSATSAEATCTEDEGVVSCDFGSMASGEQGTITIVATPSTFGTFVNVVEVTSSVADSDLTNNRAEASVEVAQVLPQIVTTTTTTAPPTTTTAAPTTTVASTQETLPFTGSSAGGVGGTAAALILLGGLLLMVAGSRRRADAPELG